jgi:apolipoprotein N-acyltransferase
MPTAPKNSSKKKRKTAPVKAVSTKAGPKAKGANKKTSGTSAQTKPPPRRSKESKKDPAALWLRLWSGLWLAPKTFLAAASGGVVLGLSCPGFEQWYLAWIGLVPLFLLIAGPQTSWKRTLTGFVYGLAYNLTYMHWYLGLAPLDWLGFPGIQGNCLATLAWLITSTHQALAFGFFALAAGLIPTNGSFAFKKAGRSWQLPALVILPLLWVLIVNKIGNAQDLMGVPWTQLEYTQYRQTAFLQGASILGGIGVSCLIVFVNVTLASLIATFKNKAAFKPLAASSRESAYYHCLAMMLIVGAFIAVGMRQKDFDHIAATTPVAIIQGGINIDMQKSEHTYSLEDLTNIYGQLMATCKNELCVMTEGALPTYLGEQKATRQWLASEARSKHLDIVVGAMDRDSAGRPYNAAYGIASSGKMMDRVYHKRYLVPFGEYAPVLVEYLPEWVRRWTNTPAGGGFASGKEALSFSFDLGRVAPLICFECISPEQTARSCREGGQLLVNISDLAWFHESDCGLQMVAFSVLRAIENRRYFVFAANTGPSAIIDTNGNISEYSPHGGKAVVQGKVGFNPHNSFFSMWYR